MDTRTKIVATIGPERKIHNLKDRAVEGDVLYDDMIAWLFEAGVDVIRLNMSHRSPDGEREQRFSDSYRSVRYLWEGLKKEVAILGDLQGPKIRIGNFFDDPEAVINLEPGGTDFILHTRQKVTGDQNQVAVLYEGQSFVKMADHVVPGSKIWLGDGEALLEVKEVTSDGKLSCQVHSGGLIKGGRGVTVKGAAFDLESFTDKDREDLKFLMSIFGSDLTYVALSFVRNAEDILKVKCFIREEYRKLLGDQRDVSIKSPGLIAKIETGEAVERISEILDVVDGIMIARGDLGMQLELEELAGIQKRIIHECNIRGKPVITATQMLDSMERNPAPTRAEVTDVYNAIFDGTDAVMLSGETSKGAYPVQAVRTMRKIAARAEADYSQLTNAEDRFLNLLRQAELTFPSVQQRVREKIEMSRTSANCECYLLEYEALQALLETQQATDRVSHAACNLSIGVPATAIMATTTSGQTVRMVARFRPTVPIIGATHTSFAARKLTLCSGVYPLNILSGHDSSEKIFQKGCELAKKIVVRQDDEKGEPRPIIRDGELIVITAGYPLNLPGTTNLVKLHSVN